MSRGVRREIWELQGVVAVWIKEQWNVQACSSKLLPGSSKLLPGMSLRWELALQGRPGKLWLQVGLACEQR